MPLTRRMAVATPTAATGLTAGIPPICAGIRFRSWLVGMGTATMAITTTGMAGTTTAATATKATTDMLGVMMVATAMAVMAATDMGVITIDQAGHVVCSPCLSATVT